MKSLAKKPTKPAKWLAMSRCKDGVNYELYSRNLFFGVYSRARRGFIGIREKLGNRFLFTERPWNTGIHSARPSP